MRTRKLRNKVSNLARLLRFSLFLPIAVIVTAIGTFALSEFSAQEAPRPPAALPAPNSSISKASIEPSERVEVVPITVLSTGFEPNEINYPSKPFVLAVDNQSGLENLALALHREDDKDRVKIRDLQLSLKSLRKRQLTDLKPGRYVLTELNHPNWTCLITITTK